MFRTIYTFCVSAGCDKVRHTAKLLFTHVTMRTFRVLPQRQQYVDLKIRLLTLTETRREN